MSNERLRSQITAAGMNLDQLAESLTVDPKTVERWITKERVPHRRHRWATAKLLDVDEAYLWPEVLEDPRTQSASQAEFVTLYPHRGAVPGDMWTTLIADACDSIDVLVYSGLFFLDSHPELVSHLLAKAECGLKARFMFGDPSSSVVTQRGLDEGIGDNMATRIRLSLDAIGPATKVPGIEVRSHATVLYNSIYRFDDQLLVNTHVYGAPAPQNPVMHLRRVPGGRLFDHYMQSFDRVWATADPIEPHPA